MDIPLIRNLSLKIVW